MRAGGLIFFTIFLSGCYAQGPEELDRLTKEDPAFKQMIVARDQARGQNRLIKKDMLAKKQVLDTQIERLRAEYNAYAGLGNKKIEQYRNTILLNANQLKREADAIAVRLEAKQRDLAGYEKTLVDFKKILREGKGIHFSSEERKNFEERILMLSEKIRPLADEIAELKLQLRLKKQKTAYLN